MSRTALIERSAQASVLAEARRLLATVESKTGVEPVYGASRSLWAGAVRRPAPTESVLTPDELARRVGPRLRPGAVVQVTGSLAALWAVAAVAAGPEDWTAVAALPEAGLLAAAEAGLAVGRTVVVPDLGAQPLRAVAGLVDAYGLVVAGKLSLSAGDRRRVEARLRSTGGRLVTAGRWSGASVTVRVDRVHVAALGENQGLARNLSLDCQVAVKGGFGALP